jgi:hypothetical protein
MKQFTKEYLRSRIVSPTSVHATLKKALIAEEIFKKPFTEFTKEEILQMYQKQHSRSAVSLQNQNVILKHAAKWLIATSDATSGINNYEKVTKDDIEKCVDIKKLQKMLLSEEELRNITDDCINAIDKAILWLLFYGVAGEWLKELTFLESWQLNKEDSTLALRDFPAIHLNKEVSNIVAKAFEETQLISYTDKIVVSEVKGQGQLYKIRNNTIYDIHDYTNQKDLERRFRWVLRRITILRQYFEINLTMKSLQTSGFWHFSHKEMEQLSITDFKSYLQTENGKALAQRYGFTSNLYVQVILDKYKEFL